MLLAFLALGVAIAHTGLPRWWQRAILVGAGVPIAVGVNVLRVMSLGVLSLWDINYAAGEFHHVVGLIWLLPAFILYMGVLWVLRNLIIDDEAGTDTGPTAPSPEHVYRFVRGGRLAYGAAFGTLLLASLGFRGAMVSLGYYLVKEPVPIRAPLDSVPIHLGDWDRLGKDNILDPTTVEELGTKLYLDRMYARGGDAKKGVMQVHAAYYTGTIDDVPHVPERCWGVAGYVQLGPSEVVDLSIDRTGWTIAKGLRNRATGLEYPVATAPDPITGGPVDVHMPLGDFRLRITQFQDPAKPKRRLIGGYMFIANGRMTPDAYGVRALAFERTERSAYYCKVQFSMELTVQNAEDSAIPMFRSNANELFALLLPHLMVRLPDWPSVEAMEEASSTATAPAAATP